MHLCIYAIIYSFPFENVHLPAACGWYMSVYDTRCHQSKIIKDVSIAYQPQKPNPEGHWLSHPGLIPTIMASVATLKGGGWQGCRFWKLVFRWLISLLPNKPGELVTGVEMHHVSTVLRENARTVYGF